MWKKLLNSEYFLVFGKDLEVCITNYVSIWRIQFSKASFLTCLKDSNEGLDINEDDLVQKGTHILTHPEQLKSFREKVEDKMLFVTLTMSFGYPVRLKMKLVEGSKELFFKRITKQLLESIHDLRESQQELRDLLHNKDLEIEEYKCEGGEIALKFLKTIPFNDEAHVLKHPVYCEHFGPAGLPDCLLNKTVDVPEEHIVKEDKLANEINLKQETSEINGTKLELEAGRSIPVNSLKEESESSECTKSGSEPVDSVKMEGVKSEVCAFPAPRGRPRPRPRPGTAGGSPGKRRKLNL